MSNMRTIVQRSPTISRQLPGRIARGGEGVWPAAPGEVRWTVRLGCDDRNDITKIVRLGNPITNHLQTHSKWVVAIIPKCYVGFLLGLPHDCVHHLSLWHYDSYILFFIFFFIFFYSRYILLYILLHSIYIYIHMIYSCHHYCYWRHPSIIIVLYLIVYLKNQGRNKKHRTRSESPWSTSRVATILRWCGWILWPLNLMNIYSVKHYIPVVPHKAVAEVSKIGNLW